jgi:hypothetical protein
MAKLSKSLHQEPTAPFPAEGSPPRRLGGPRRELAAQNSAPPEAETKVFLATKH